MPRILFRTILLAVLAVLAAAAPAFAAQRYAAPTGTAAANSGCLQIDPCSIANAVLYTYTVDGDEVILAPGVYNIGTGELDIMDAVDVHGTGAPSDTRIVGTGNLPVYLGNVGAQLRQVEINHSTGTMGAVFVAQGSVSNVIAKSTSGAGCSVNNATIRNSFCITSDDGASGVFINISGGTHAVTLRNVTGIGKGSTNTFGLYAGASGGATVTFDVKSSIFSGTTGDIYANGSTGASTVTLDHSNYGTVTVVGATVTSNATNFNQAGDPVFVNAATDDYRQATSSSTTIDLGAVDGQSGATDIDGEARTIGPAPDIGADEIDNVGPDAPTIGAPAAGTVTTDTTLQVQGGAEDGATVRVFDGATEVCSATSTGGAYSCVTPVLAEGPHSLRAFASDPLGNDGPFSGTVAVTIDLTAPTVTVSAPASGSTAGASPTVTFNIGDANPGASECRVDGGAFAACSSGSRMAALADGAHTLDVRHTDAAGNAGTGSTSFTVDATGPRTAIGKKPKSKTTKRKAKFTFGSSEPDSTFKCKLDRAAFRACRSPFTKKVKPGRHKLKVFAIDRYGNSDATPATYKWKVLKR